VAIINNTNLNIFKLLKNKGADIKYVNVEGETYLMVACSKLNSDNNINNEYYIELFSILLDNISSEEKNKSGKTCIDYIDDENKKKYFKEMEYSLDLLNIIVNFYNSPIDNEIVDTENVYRHIIKEFLEH
jgi:ankyrin repeat protein